eukprot:UN31969
MVINPTFHTFNTIFFDFAARTIFGFSVLSVVSRNFNNSSILSLYFSSYASSNTGVNFSFKPSISSVGSALKNSSFSI